MRGVFRKAVQRALFLDALCAGASVACAAREAGAALRGLYTDRASNAAFRAAWEAARAAGRAGRDDAAGCFEAWDGGEEALMADGKRLRDRWGRAVMVSYH